MTDETLREFGLDPQNMGEKLLLEFVE